MCEEINVRHQSKQVASGNKSNITEKIHSKQNRTYIGKESEILRHNQNEQERDVGSFELGINVRERAFIRALSYLFAQRISSDRKYFEVLNDHSVQRSAYTADQLKHEIYLH